MRLVSYVLLLFTVLNASAQQEPFYSHYMYGANSVNPGAAGSDDMVSLTALLRTQWMKLEGGPNTSFLNGNMPFRLFKADHGLGIAFGTDNYGFVKNTFGNLSYAYRKEIGTGKLGIGLNLGFVGNSFEPTWNIPEGSNFVAPGAGGDEAIPNTKENATAFDLGLGVFYKKENLFFGVSTTHLNQAKFKYTVGKPYLVRHYYVLGGYAIPLKNNAFTLQPSFLLGTDGFANQIMLSANVLYNNKIHGGLSYRVGNAIIAMFGLELFKDVDVGFSYDIEMTKLSRYSSGSVEVMLRYRFDMSVEKFPEAYKSIRFL